LAALAALGVQAVAIFKGPPWLCTTILAGQLIFLGYSLGQWRAAKQRLADLERYRENAEQMDAIMGKLITLMRDAGWDIPPWPGAPMSEQEKAGLN